MVEYEIKLTDNPHANEQNHTHNGYSIVLVLNGEGSYLLGRNVCTYKPGSLIIIPPLTLHMSSPKTEEYKRYLVHFPAYVVENVSTKQTDMLSILQNPQNVTLSNAQSSHLQKLLLLVQKQNQTNDFGADIKKGIAFVELLLAIGLYIKGAENPVATQSRVDPILKYIHAHIDEPLSLDVLAEHFFMSKYHLSRLFKQSTGFTPGLYITRCRLFNAQELLRKGYSVQHAGEACGFCDYAHFIRTFKQHVGISPGKYARQSL